MKIAFFVYPSAFQSPGGGEILLLKTKEALQAQGVSVTLFNQWEDKLKDFDILHVFGSVKDCLGLMSTAKSLGVINVLSPVYWSTLQRALHEHGGLARRSQMALQHIAKVVLPVIPSARRKMFLLADSIVPNAQVEADQVSRLFAIPASRMSVVPLGADEKFAAADPAEFRKKYSLKDFILSVGRFEPRKNQLNLIRALRGFNVPLVFIGNPVAEYRSYYELCKREADPSTIFIDRLEHSDTLLASAYAASRAFVLQGWFETPGLVALEAGLAGANLAVTCAGSTREYFKEFVEYLDPADLHSIRGAVERALQKDRSQALRAHILGHYLWHHSAECQIRVYKKLLNVK
ncbi:MAG: glycosyltransferase family 4 protein [Candidatus Omnitrophota bacterium]